MSSTHVRRAPLIALAAGFFILATPAVSQAQLAMCGERAQIVELLKTKYKEAPQAVGVISDNGVVELFVSEKRTWTMLMTLANGKSCILAAGHSWESAPMLARGTGI